MQTSLTIMAALLGAIQLYPSPILIKPPATETGDRVRIEIKIKDSEGNNVSTIVSTARAPIGGNSSAENAQELADAVNDLTGGNFKATVQDGEMLLSPGVDSLGGIDGEPSWYYDKTFNTLLNLLSSQDFNPLLGEEVGYESLDWIGGTVVGDGQVLFSVGDVTAIADTFSGESSSELLGSLDAQLEGGGITTSFDGTTLTAYSDDVFSFSQTDSGSFLGAAGGTAPVPEPFTAALIGAGLVVLGTLRRRQPPGRVRGRYAT